MNLISEFQSLIEEIENKCENMELMDFKFNNSKSDNCRLLVKVNFKLMDIVNFINKHEQYCKENNLNGNNVSILILKDIENELKTLEESIIILKNDRR